jgi:soluble lytic murein transglycosylase-like protein
LRNEPAPVATKEAYADYFTANPGVDRGRLARSAIALAKEFHLDPQLVLAVIRAESNFDPFALSPKNAQGMMQLIPETAERFAVQNPFDPIQNMRGGMRYLRWLLSYFRGDVALTLAAYNAGEGAVDRHRGIPPYPETVSYVQRIRAFYPADRHPFDAKLVPASSWIPDRQHRPRTQHSLFPTIASD